MSSLPSLGQRPLSPVQGVQKRAWPCYRDPGIGSPRRRRPGNGGVRKRRRNYGQDSLSRITGVRVVVAGVARADPALRSILETEGFRVVGQAATAHELRRVLSTARPDVVVFGAEATAMTVLAVRDWVPGIGIVVVWPPGVSEPAADQQVDPARAVFDLKNAVRKAVRRRPPVAAPVALPDAPVSEESPEVAAAVPVSAALASKAGPRESRFARRGANLAFALTTAFLFVLAAIAWQQGFRTGFVAQPSRPSQSVVGAPVPGDGSLPECR